MTKDELAAKLRRFPMAQEQERARLVASLSAAMLDKDALASGMRGRAMDGMPHGSGTTSDPTAQTVMQIDRMFGEEIADITARIAALSEETKLIQAALDWLRLQPNGQQMHSVVYWRYVQGDGWSRASRNAHYSERGAKKAAKRAFELMAQWTRR